MSALLRSLPKFATQRNNATCHVWTSSEARTQPVPQPLVAKLDVSYRFNGQPAEHAIYQTQPGGSFVSLTFVDGIVIELADIGLLPDDDIFQGR
jgi:hypothetical protein